MSIDGDVLLCAEPHTRECQLAEVQNARSAARGNHVVLGLHLLQHHPHGSDVIARVPPIAFGMQVAKRKLFLHSKLNSRDASSDLTRDELDAAQRGLVIEQDTATIKHLETLAV